jgi:hypothetical protein
MDRIALETAARTVEAALADEGTPLTRDALAARLRDAGHTVSNSRASDLVKLLRANRLAIISSAPAGGRMAYRTTSAASVAQIDLAGDETRGTCWGQTAVGRAPVSFPASSIW